jgi:CHAT domain-containing protein/pimeloyl-ACP methyl ester carboxylesterase
LFIKETKVKTIKVLGQSDETLKDVNFGKEFENFSVSSAVQFASDRSAASYHEIKDLKDDDVVELIFEDDIHRWVTVSELEEQFKYQISRGAEAGVIEIPDRLPSGDTSRGATSWVLTGLRVLKFDPVEKSAEAFAKAWDKKLMPEPGLYRFNEKLDQRGEHNPKIEISKPVLLFIHGTFSSTENGFKSLQSDVWDKLKEKYGEQIFGFDHRTLSESPIQNALELVEKLPKGVKLDLVTHSRGGLIGELLCRSGRIESQTLFDNDDENLMAEDKAALSKLSKLLEEKEITVERFVRVACPTRGTTLASKRFDRYLEIILNVIAKVLPPGPGNIFGVLADLLLDFKKQSANPEAMPGLAAMDPESNFIRMINRTDVKVRADLTVIAGDIEKNNLVGRLAIFFTDLFYFDEHDLVVQTPAMYGGPSRKEGRYFFDQGADVNHFHYFSNPKTAEKIRDALIAEPENLVAAQGFRPLQEAYVKAVPDVEITARSYQKRSSIPQPVVYILPGVMGTHLSEGDNRIWLDLLDLSLGKLVNLQISNPDVQPQALVAFAYADLVEYLSATHEVIPFPYDWRLSILDEAKRFASEIEAKLKETDQPIRIIAHSMGGLVARAMLGQRPDLWDEIRKRDGARFIMLGTPNEGSYQIPRLILGQEKTLRMLALLDIKNSTRDLLEVIARFPGVLGLLPMEDEPRNFLEASTWDEFPNTGGRGWVKPTQKDLDQAKELRGLLKAEKGMIGAEDPILYVAGYAQGAPIAMDYNENHEVIFRATDQGDGTVPWASGILPELKDGRTYYLNAPHGDLAKRKETFPAIYDLLAKGSTDRLPKIPPRYDRGQEESYELRDEGVEIYPTQLDLETTVLGATPVKYEVPQVKPVRVSVAHGNLSFCSNPVAVGHYEGDSFYSAEKALDHHLNGRLNARHVLGLYPGPDGTVGVVLNDKGEKPGGAIIVGLGKAGDLSPNKLSGAFAMAMREYAVKAVENGRVKDGEITISTLLIGTGGMGLTVTNSVDAILNGVIQANRSLTQLADTRQSMKHLNYSVRISEVQFIELFKDQAILATRALKPFTAKAEFSVNPLLQTLRGGWKRIAYEEPAGWWNRIYIRASDDNDDTLIFTVPTDRARSEESRLGVQRNNVDGLIAQSVRNPNWDENLATAMFELMIPNRLKGSFKDMNNALFVVDEQAASYPWELLYDRRMGRDLPIVVQVGMIRQFSTRTFRETVVDVKNKNVLVIGNPADTPANFANLPGAEQEAILVASKFKENGYEVQPSIHSTSSSIMIDLFSKDYRVLHLAGHGVYKYSYQAAPGEKSREVTGMVLGNGVFLTANEIQNKMNVPELVFINCCHLGVLSDQSEENEEATGTQNEFNKFAASLSRELIEMGVKAVVAAGWAVDDAAALSFAEVFYDHLLRGYPFGDAIKAARAEIYKQHGGRTNTWAAYQCYGDPAYRLVVKTGGGGRWEERFVDIEEAIAKIDQITEKAKTASALDMKRLKNDLNNLLKDLEKKDIQVKDSKWLDAPRLLETLGQAFAEVFLFEEAVKFYDAAVRSGKSAASIKAIEQSANCHIRLAVQRFELDPHRYTESKADIETQIETLTQLMRTLRETPERLSMIGSGYKRLAQIASSKPSNMCNSALKQMEEYYRRAWKHTPDKSPKDPYPLTNALAAQVALLLRLGDEQKVKKELPELKNQKDEAQRFAKGMKDSAPEDFWATIGVTDLKLLDYLIDYLDRKKRPPDQVCEELLEEYKKAWKQYGSQREINSVIEHYAFLVAILKECDQEDQVCGVLRKIHNELRSMSEAAD